MMQAGKAILIVGAVLVVIGAVVWALGGAGVRFRGLPGDIRYESGPVRVYFPIVTCVVLSILLTLALWLWNWLSGR